MNKLILISNRIQIYHHHGKNCRLSFCYCTMLGKSRDSHKNEVFRIIIMPELMVVRISFIELFLSSLSVMEYFNRYPCLTLTFSNQTLLDFRGIHFSSWQCGWSSGTEVLSLAKLWYWLAILLKLVTQSVIGNYALFVHSLTIFLNDIMD